MVKTRKLQENLNPSNQHLLIDFSQCISKLKDAADVRLLSNNYSDLLNQYLLEVIVLPTVKARNPRFLSVHNAFKQKRTMVTI